MCDEHGIGGEIEYCGGNDAQHEALGINYAPRAVLCNLKLGVIGNVIASPIGVLSRPENLVNQNAGAGNNWVNAHYKNSGLL
jgi:hypothetical protein